MRCIHPPHNRYRKPVLRASCLVLSWLVMLALLLLPPLTASAETLTLVKPTGGETLYIGTAYTVEWTGFSGTNVSVYLNTDIGPTVPYEHLLGMSASGSLTFTVPDKPTTTAWIHIYTPYGGGYFDNSENNITITKAVIPMPGTPIIPIDPIVNDPILIDPSLFMPQTPEDLEVVSISADEISLAWTDTSAREEGFTIERKTGGGSFSKIGQTAADITSFTDANVTSGTAYTYRVQAYNAFGTSNYSNEVTVQTPSVVTPPDPQPAETTEETIVMHFYIDNPDYFVNGALNTMDAPPTIFEGRTVLPIKYVAEPLGAAVGWDAGPRRVRITHQERVIDLWIGQNRAEVNGAGALIDPNNDRVTPIVLPPGRTMLPLKFIAQQLGAQVDWDQGQRRVTITYPAP